VRDHLDMAAALGRDRLRSFVDVVLASLDDPASGAELAGRVYRRAVTTGALRLVGADVPSSDPIEWERQAD
jgi:hypothetical protein